MGAQTRTDVLPYISLIPVFGYLWPGTSTISHKHDHTPRGNVTGNRSLSPAPARTRGRGRGEVLGQAGVVEACAYTPKVTPRGKIRFLI